MDCVCVRKDNFLECLEIGAYLWATNNLRFNYE